MDAPVSNYLNSSHGLKSWLLTRDHKRIALLYLVAVTVFFFVGGAFAVLIRLDLATPAGVARSSRMSTANAPPTKKNTVTATR